MINKSVHIKAGLLFKMLQEIENSIPYETGGVIAGRFSGKDCLIITHITMPGPKADHKRSSFKPDYDFDEKEIARIYEETHCQSVYLGDWHSHPDSKSYMSGRDKNTLRNIAKSPESRIENPIMIIVGTSPLEIGCWMYMNSKRVNDAFQAIQLILIGSE